MSADDDPVEPPQPRASSTRGEDVSALWWLARWLGLPFLVVVGIYYAEPMLSGRPGVEVVPAVTRQEVRPYPFPEGATGPSLAPPEIPRVQPIPLPPMAPVTVGTLPAAEIVANPIAQPKPSYPRRALEQEKEGVVRLRVTIAADGSVADAVVTYADPPGWFETAALEAVRRWRYQPPGRVLVTAAEIEFKLD